MKFFRYLHTLRHLRPIQFLGRLRLYIYRLRPDLGPAPSLRQKLLDTVTFPGREPQMRDKQTFCINNQMGTLSEGWNPPGRSKLWLYILHYFQDLTANGAETHTEWHEDLIRRWVTENPPGQGTGWEPYPTSLRMVNWIKWELSVGSLPTVATESLAVQARWLSRRIENHLLGNHLFANAKALILAGLFFQGDEAEKWYAKGKRLLDCEIREQVLPDGGHFERSPMYHLIVLEDMLDLINIHRAYGISILSHWYETANRMQYWSKIMRHPDGQIPFFNDATLGVALKPSEIDAYADYLDVSVNNVPKPGEFVLPDSGFYKVQLNESAVLIDVGSVGPKYQPGHAHAATLSLELSVEGYRILVNSGISEYGKGPERIRQRSTEAHNTVSVDSANSSEVWAGFRVARRAKVFDLRIDRSKQSISASHDGYHRLSGKPTHRRKVIMRNGWMEVIDAVYGRGSHQTVGFWHFHPDLEVLDIVKVDETTTCLKLAYGMGQLSLWIEGADNVRTEPNTWHPGFGVSRKNTRLVFELDGELPHSIRTSVYWNPRNAPR